MHAGPKHFARISKGMMLLSGVNHSTDYGTRIESCAPNKLIRSWPRSIFEPEILATELIFYSRSIFEPADFGNRTDMLFEVYIWTCRFWQPNWYAIRGLYLNLQILATELIFYSRSIFEPADFGNRTDILFEVYIWTCRFWQPNWYSIRGLYLNLQILATELIF